ncbi:MAG TPA: transcriptional regulator [Streptosporangiaceae bacterium]|nr:transcriptional regulator [Streptosporangiaceae bacterium]
MTYRSAAADLALHGVRVLGFPTAARIARRYGLDPHATGEHLLDFEARGWVRQLSFAGTSGWSMTEAGRLEDERRLAAELDQAQARDLVIEVHAEFLPLNGRLGRACTDWQIRPTAGDPMAFNDHSDWRWDDRVLGELASLEKDFARLCGRLAACLGRFEVYSSSFSAALARAQTGQRAWIDAADRDSCHLVWIQFHEDLLATLGLLRGSDT